MNKTPIDWTDYTINPFRFRNLETGKVGHHCAKISPGCKNCYSSAMQAGPYLSGLTFIEENKPKGEFFLDEGALQQVLKRKKPARIFWCDMTDMFLDDYPDEWIDRCFAVMALTGHLTHQVLTKRPDRLYTYMISRQKSARFWKAACPAGWKFEFQSPLDGTMYSLLPFPLPNVWLGVSVEDRERKERIDCLRDTPAAVRFLSLEPLLEDLDKLDLLAIHWVIVGGESGPGARPMDIAWVRSIRDQCNAAGVACFVKQLGAKPEGPQGCGDCDPCMHRQPCMLAYNVGLELRDKKGGDMSEWSPDLRVRQMPFSAPADPQQGGRS